MTIVTRFAPSPTGSLHIGNARTALFNWLYAKHMGGKFYLRIEDTDLARSTEAAIKIIIDSLTWLGLRWDGDIIYQSQRRMRHIQIAKQLVASGNAYYCYMSQEEIAQSKAQNQHHKILSPWRDPKTAPATPFGINPVVRLRVNTSGTTTIRDAIRGTVSIKNTQLDDMILLRSDETPTYMLAAVVDDHDMCVNCIIRGNDHFTNTFRQNQLYRALNWPVPRYAHLPLINNPNGTKLSKRSGAKSIIEYKNEGYLPEAVCNYLLLLGWGHKNREIWAKEEVAKFFDVMDVNKAPANFDPHKFCTINAHYIQNTDNEVLSKQLLEFINFSKTGQNELNNIIARIERAIPQLKSRAKTLAAMNEIAQLYINKQNPIDKKSATILKNADSTSCIEPLKHLLNSLPAKEWRAEKIRAICDKIAVSKNIKPSTFMQILRAMVVGSSHSPGIYDFIAAIGKDETLKRIKELCHR